MILDTGTVQITNVPTMLAMNPHRDSSQPGRYRSFECSKIAAMHNRRLELPKQAKHPRIDPESVAGRLVERKELDALALDSQPKISHIGQRNHSMAVCISRHRVDQIDHTVLETTHIETVHDVDDQGARRLPGDRVIHSRCLV